MNAIKKLYRNAGLITKDGYIKVNDKLWVKSGPYQEQKLTDVDKFELPNKDELNEIRLKIKEIIQTQETCGLPSLRQILECGYSWAWSSTEHSNIRNWIQKMSDGNRGYNHKSIDNWFIPIRRAP